MLDHEPALGAEDLLAPGGDLALAMHEVVRLQAEALVALELPLVDRTVRLEAVANGDRASLDQDAQLFVGDIRRRDDAGAEASGLAAHRMQQVFVGVAVLERLHDQPARDAERVVHGDQIVERAVLDLEPASGIEREPPLRSEDVEMRVAGAWRQPDARRSRVPVRGRRFHVGHVASHHFFCVRPVSRSSNSAASEGGLSLRHATWPSGRMRTKSRS